MSDNNVTRTGGGMGLLGWLFIVFLILKLTDWQDNPVHDWSWWWVTAPLWGPVALGLGILLIVGVGWGIIRLFESKESKNRREAVKALDNLANRFSR
jgi:hypothetical protein